MRRAERMTNVLRRALRLVVEREGGPAARAVGVRRAGGDPDPPAAHRDEVLPGLDSREPGLFDQ